MNILQKSSETLFSKEELFLANNYSKCPTHSNRKLQFLSTDTSSKYKLKCVDCLAQSNNRNFIPLLTLLDGDKKTIFRNWPVINDDQIYDELIQISKRNPFKEETQRQIQAFFKEFRVMIDQKLEIKQSEMMKYTDDFYDINDKIFNQYNQLSAKEELVDIILNQRDDFEKQNQQLSEIVQRVLLSQESSKKSLLETISHISNLHEIITFDAANKVKQNIIEQIKGIDLFVVRSLEDMQMNNHQKQVEVIKQNISRMKIEDMNTSQLIIKLINCQLNNCSKELLNELTQTVLKIENFLNKQQVNIGQTDEHHTFPFDQLNSQQMQKLKNLAHLTEKQIEEILCLITEFKQKNQTNNSTIQLRNQNEEKEALNRFNQLIHNKSNYCKKEFLQNCQSAAQKFPECINHIYLQDKNIFQENCNPINFQDIQDKQLKDINILVAKIAQLQNQYGINYQYDQ
ncbi:kinase domain protein, putative (macronuclear) [Tetrahymena thermophila SB210]|uniref:Kinase domain protein, putative n=1 Tax=Tetrahymena thermophila (strain SB210) TaxID=312017 RepID=Q229E1_TETTS|nr:kinase domain protein, putative [Tetrahymena thermophila SB210]EAR81901.2 kinase domain protein, putative [Tetrahymena thermophila SB210]|eukprot:XP_001029564.2 kinase domain protein, putative [Tetrahymena thermophila SB210]